MNEPPPIQAPPTHDAERRPAAVIRRIGALVALLAVLAVHTEGQWLPALIYGLLVVPAISTVFRGVLLVRHRLLFPPYRGRGAAAVRAAWAQFVIRAGFWLCGGFAVRLSLPAAAFSRTEHAEVLLFFQVLAILQASLEALQPPRTYRSTNVVALVMLVLLGWECVHAVGAPRGPAVELAPPLSGKWAVVQGGNSGLLNHHYPIVAQRYALDLVAEQRQPPREPDRLESYPAFGRPIRAPASGRVVVAKGDSPDQAIGASDLRNPVGNHVVIEIAPGRFVLLAHLQQRSLRVAPGERVTAGQPIANCGNSGNTSEPHLHLQVQSHQDFAHPSLRTFPIRWRGGRLFRGGSPLPAGSFLRRNDVIEEERES
jgi:hypothetical protein